MSDKNQSKRTLFLKKGISTLKGIVIILLAFLICGGVIGCYYWLAFKKEVTISGIENLKEKIADTEEAGILGKETLNKISAEISKEEFTEITLEEIRKGTQKIENLKMFIPFKVDEQEIIFEGYMGYEKIGKKHETYYEYQGNNFKVDTFPDGEDRRGQIFYVNELRILDPKTKEFELIWEGYCHDSVGNFIGNLIGYKDNLIVITNDEFVDGPNIIGGSNELFIYNPVLRKKDSESIKFSYSLDEQPPFSTLIEGRRFSLVIKENELYLKGNNDYYYLRGTCYGESERMYGLRSLYGCDSIFGAGIDKYYLLDNGEIIEKRGEFKNTYLKKALKYDFMLNSVDWEDVKTTDQLACLSKGTKILMADGSYKNIEDIKKGDMVRSFDVMKKGRWILSFDKAEKKFKTSEVIEIIQRKDPIITINNVLKAAPDELIYLLNGDIKMAVKLEIGDYLVNERGEKTRIDLINYSYDKIETYDLKLKGAENFFANGYLVHTPEEYLHLYIGGWLSPLIGRTLNLIFAGEEEKAWEAFDENFAKFSERYPLPEQDKIDPQQIKQEIQEDLRKGD